MHPVRYPDDRTSYHLALTVAERLCYSKPFMPSGAHTCSLRIQSIVDMLDYVQVVSDRVSVMAGLDEDATHWVGVAVRESVINAIKHGNRHDRQKSVTVEFSFTPEHEPRKLIIRVMDEGEGFVPEEVADPLAPENLLKSSGRGIFFMRSFMDDVTLTKRPEGGMEVRMVKNLDAAVA
ncbi:MAG: ATP-binding protein [Vicinamibacterales bacterium]